MDDKEKEIISSLNPGIRKLVGALRKEGFRTLDSGDGETHEFACDRIDPYVIIESSPEKMVEETHRLVDFLAARGIKIHQISDKDLPCIQSSYDPMTRTAYIDLMNVTDKLLESN